MVHIQRLSRSALATLLIAAPAAAAPVNYDIEPNHTYPSFKVPHMGISYWRGKFNKTSGTVVLDREANSGTVDIRIDASSIDFGHDKLNEHALTEDFFNAERYPTITYTGDIVFEDDKPASVDGQLTLLGTTKPVVLTIHSFACIEHPMLKKEVCGADASGSFNRSDFGMSKYGEGPAGDVDLEIQVEAVRR